MGKIKFDRVIVYDLELTTSGNRNSKDAVREIIEIGLVVLNTQNGTIVDKASYIVRPKIAKISEYCEKLTGITQAAVDKAYHLDSITGKILNDFGSNIANCSFGSSDRVFLSKECRDKNARYPFSQDYIDIALLISLKLGLKQNTSLVDCLELIGEKFTGIQHSAVSDAENTAKLLWHLIKR